MAAPVFIGDEVAATAYRLACVATRVPGFGEVPRVFDEAINEAELVIIAADFAGALPGDTLKKAVRRAEPLVLVVPDGSHRQLPDDIADGVDRVLGIER